MLSYIDPDEFAAWRNHPITQYVLKGVDLMREEVRGETMHIFFDADGFVNPDHHWLIHYNRGVFDAYSTISGITLDELTRAHNGEDEE